MENGIWIIAPEENCPPVRVRIWFRVSVRIRVGGNFPRRQLSWNQWVMPMNIWSTVTIDVLTNIHQKLFWRKAKNWFHYKNFFENMRNASKQEIYHKVGRKPSHHNNLLSSFTDVIIVCYIYLKWNACIFFTKLFALFFIYWSNPQHFF